MFAQFRSMSGKKIGDPICVNLRNLRIRRLAVVLVSTFDPCSGFFRKIQGNYFFGGLFM
jgi:hypothetical protein